MNPFRALRKLLFSPLKYGWRDYAAFQYWDERHRRYGMDIRGSGNEGKNDFENVVQYSKDQRQFTQLVRDVGVSLPHKRILDVGCGNGMYAYICEVADSYVGVDITDALFPSLQKMYPKARLVRQDCTILGNLDLGMKFDVVLAISVIEHITTRFRLASAMVNMRNALAPDGVLFVGPVYSKAKHRLFYHHPWRESDVRAVFDVAGRVKFRDGEMLALRAKR